MSTFRLHLWREWREHRLAFGSLGIVLPLGTWMLALQLSRTAIGDPLFHGCVALAFTVVMLIVVGGELLGSERRGTGLRWLERLPTGLAGAFRAKLAFLVLSGILAAAYGFGTGWTVARLRHAPFASSSQELGLLVPLVLVLGVWTFAVSTWALRGGLSVLAAALVLTGIGFPAWRLVDAGYSPGERELEAALALLVGGGLLSAALGFVHGARLGRGALAAGLYGLAPAALLAAAATAWASVRMAERARFDPLSAGFVLEMRDISVDGRVALLTGAQDLPSWRLGSTPRHVLRVDLETGAYTELGSGTSVSAFVRQLEDERGMPVLDDLVLQIDERPPLAFDLADGAPRAWDGETRRGATPEGLGARWLRSKPGDRDVIRDPFRGRDYPVAAFAELVKSGSLLVRPGRWLHSGNRMRWTWIDPDTNVREPAGWPDASRPLVLFEDGRILLANSTSGLEVVHPERGEVRALDSAGVAPERILHNPDGLRTWRSTRDAAADARGTILLQTQDREWLVIDAEATSVRRIAVGGGFQLLRRVGDDAAVVHDWNRRCIVRLDLATGATTPLWPPEPAR